jgi:hypothetical protein
MFNAFTVFKRQHQPPRYKIAVHQCCATCIYIIVRDVVDFLYFRPDIIYYLCTTQYFSFVIIFLSFSIY